MLERFIKLLLTNQVDTHSFSSLDGDFTVLTSSHPPDPSHDTLWFDHLNLYFWYAGSWRPLEALPYRSPVLKDVAQASDPSVVDLGRAHLAYDPVNDQEIASLQQVLECEQYLRQVEEGVVAYLQKVHASFDRLQVQETSEPDHVVNLYTASSYFRNLQGKARTLAQSVASRNLRLQELDRRIQRLQQRLTHVAKPDYARNHGVTFTGSVELPATHPIDEEEPVTWATAMSVPDSHPAERVSEIP